MFGKNQTHVPLCGFIASLSQVIDLVNPALAHHHERVGAVAFALALEMGLDMEECKELRVAGEIHDIGALSVQERISALAFQDSQANGHGEAGAQLLSLFAPLRSVAELVRYHHRWWDGGNGATDNGRPVPRGSHILHLADRVAVLVDDKRNPLDLAKSVTRKIFAHEGDIFMPEAVAAFRRLADTDCFWFELIAHSFGVTNYGKAGLETIELDMDNLLSLTRMFSRIIDFRCSFTASHSSGVAAIGEELARLSGFSETESLLMRVAGYLHDLGKLAVPTDILEKPGPLTTGERNRLRIHPFYTYRALERIPDFSIVTAWSAFHHECPDGTGYPFRIAPDNLTLGSRIIAVADVFTALTENRPYRPAMECDQALDILSDMGRSGALDQRVVFLMHNNAWKMDAIRRRAQADAILEYEALRGIMVAAA